MRTASEAVSTEPLADTPTAQALRAFEHARRVRAGEDRLVGPVLGHYLGTVACKPNCSHPHSASGDSGIDQTPENIGY